MRPSPGRSAAAGLAPPVGGEGNRARPRGLVVTTAGAARVSKRRSHTLCHLMARTRSRAGGYNWAILTGASFQTLGLPDVLVPGDSHDEEGTHHPHLPRPIPIPSCHYLSSWDTYRAPLFALRGFGTSLGNCGGMLA